MCAGIASSSLIGASSRVRQSDVISVCNYCHVPGTRRKMLSRGALRRMRKKEYRTHLNGRAAWGMLRNARRGQRGMVVHRIFPRCIVVECSRVPPLPPPTEPTITIIAINQHQHHNSRRRNDCFLSHSVSRWRSLSRRYFGPPLAGRPGNVHSRNLVAAGRYRHSM